MGLMGLSGKEKEQPKMGRAPHPSLGPNRTRRGGRPPSLFPPSANPIPTRRRGEEKGGRRPLPFPNSDWGKGAACHLLAASPPPSLGPMRPNSLQGGSGNPLALRFYPKHFRCPNNMVQYINLYVSTISRLLVMSVITSGTPNNLRYIKSHKLIIPIAIKR